MPRCDCLVLENNYEQGAVVVTAGYDLADTAMSEFRFPCCVLFFRCQDIDLQKAESCQMGTHPTQVQDVIIREVLQPPRELQLQLSPQQRTGVLLN